ncbi:hypothetical protein D1B31_00595 [Neobacillus notoginsengisoli]|uniref:DUF2268 domain-containing protein n=1 Tax=Neobacillus notoginsengisoli TaxID=1578198 RepID=A0A417YZ66_9BACI|nr:DUF2268 domain-containing putative Zn-dependent protease [Neobacillus notoginsengisoli]RHW43209.1 hypothetical protein D1B31_00595 [Neobacillus notoginsengisoli]
MGIVRTDEWLVKDWYRPEALCERLQSHFKGKSPRDIYQELLHFGMFRRHMVNETEMRNFIKTDLWENAGKILNQYTEKWHGPDLPVFIFPAAKKGSFFHRGEPQKSGVSYPDKLFLFLPESINEKELEALFVHEYHHTCRMAALGKLAEENTLLESMIMEGLAEYAVFHECGPEYLGEWCTLYGEEGLGKFWKQLLRNNLNKKKTDKIHNLLLYGGKGVPRLLGYSYGFYLVDTYYKRKDFFIKSSFEISAKPFVLTEKHTN